MKVTVQKGIGARAGCLLFAGMALLMAYIFGFSVKWTTEYDCVMEQVRRSEVIARQLGEPVEPGLVAWLYQRESEGSRVSTTFGTFLSGSRGRGRIRAEAYRAPFG